MVNITAEHICNFETHGVELIKGLFKDYIDLIREGIEFNMENPGPYAAPGSMSHSNIGIFSVSGFGTGIYLSTSL